MSRLAFLIHMWHSQILFQFFTVIFSHL